MFSNDLYGSSYAQHGRVNALSHSKAEIIIIFPKSSNGKENRSRFIFGTQNSFKQKC